MTDDRMPILIGCGQLTQRTAQTGKFEESLDPLQLLTEAATRALADTGAADKLKPLIDNISVVRFTADSSEAGPPADRSIHERPALARQSHRREGEARVLHRRRRQHPAIARQSHGRGNRQRRNDRRAARRLGRSRDDDRRAQQGHQQLKWGEDAGGEPIHIGENRRGVNDIERAHALYFPVNAYPLFENGIRGHKGRSVRDHQLALGQLFSPFSKVAAANPHVLVSEGAHARGDCDARRQQPLRRIPLHEVHERHDPGRHGGRRRHDEREDRARTRHSRNRNGSICTAAPTRPTFGTSASA